MAGDLIRDEVEVISDAFESEAYKRQLARTMGSPSTRHRHSRRASHPGAIAMPPEAPVAVTIDLQHDRQRPSAFR